MLGFGVNEIAFVAVLLFIVVLAQVAPGIGERIWGGPKGEPQPPAGPSKN